MSHDTPLSHFAEDATNTLRYQIEVGSRLSMESKSFAFIDSAKSTLGQFLDQAGIFLNSLKFGNYIPRDIPQGVVYEALHAEGFAEARKRTWAVPAGFSSKYQDYLKDIRAVMSAIAVLEKSLKVATVRVASILTEPDRLKAQSGIRDLEKQVMLISAEQLDNLTAHHKNGSKSQVLLSQVVNNLSEIDSTYLEVRDLNTQLSRIDLAGVSKQIHRLAELVRELNATVAKDEHREVSGLVASQLADLLYRMGITATAASVVADGIGQLSDSLIQNAEALK